MTASSTTTAHPVYPRVVVRAGTAAVVTPTCPLPEGRLALAPGSPDWATLSPDGTLTLAPPAETREGRWVITVQALAPDGAVCCAVVEVDVEGAPVPEAERHEIDPWCEVALSPGLPGGVAVITVDGGRPLPDGAHAETARDGSCLRCVPVTPDALWVSSPRLRPTVRVRVIYSDGSTDGVDAALRLPDVS